MISLINQIKFTKEQLGSISEKHPAYNSTIILFLNLIKNFAEEKNISYQKAMKIVNEL